MGVVRFGSNTEILTPSLTDNKVAANNFMTTSYFKSSGNTYMYSAILKFMTLFKTTDSLIMKLIVVLSDWGADTSMPDSVVSSAAGREMKIYTVGLGSGSSSYFTSFLKPLANNTCAAVYLASSAVEITNI